MLKTNMIKTISASLLLGFIYSTTANALIINEIEANDSLATAQYLGASNFSLNFNDDIGSQDGTNTSTVIPNVSILGSGNGTYDYYSFDIGSAGLGIFDIDYGALSTNHVDTELALWDESGTVLTTNDDFFISAGANGSVSGLDSFIQYDFITAGLYYIGVASFDSVAETNGWTGTPVTGGEYTLQVSLENAITGIPGPITGIPEPTTLALMGLGLVGLGFSRGIKKS